MSLSFEQHADDETLEIYARGKLDDAPAEVLEQHLLICEGCRVRLTEADRYVHAMRSASARLLAEKSSWSAAGWFEAGAFWERFPASFRRWLVLSVPAFAAFFAVIIATTSHRSSPLSDSEVKVSLVSLRGGSLPFQSKTDTAPAHRRLDLDLDARGLDLGPRARVELVNDSGIALETASSPETAQRVEMHTRNGLQPGSYFVRLYAADSRELSREFALQIK